MPLLLVRAKKFDRKNIQVHVNIKLVCVESLYVHVYKSNGFEYKVVNNVNK